MCAFPLSEKAQQVAAQTPWQNSCTAISHAYSREHKSNLGVLLHCSKSGFGTQMPHLAASLRDNTEQTEQQRLQESQLQNGNRM
jgi:hypothetical protein